MGDKNEGKRDNWKISKDIYKEEVYGVTEVDRYQKLAQKSWRVQEQTKSDNVKYDYYSIKSGRRRTTTLAILSALSARLSRVSLAAAAVA